MPRAKPKPSISKDLHTRMHQIHVDGEAVVQRAFDNLCPACQDKVRDDLSSWLSGLREHLAEVKSGES